jgi:disease resistance protein RPM1
MAEWIVNLVLGKLADVAVQEVLSLHGVDKQVETMSRELGRIQAFLKDADKKQITDNRQKYWIKEVRDLAYSIEDAIDTFLMEIPQEPQNSTGMMQDMKMMIKKAKKYTPVHKLVDEISLIQTKMKEIQMSRLRYVKLDLNLRVLSHLYDLIFFNYVYLNIIILLLQFLESPIFFIMLNVCL